MAQSTIKPGTPGFIALLIQYNQFLVNVEVVCQFFFGDDLVFLLVQDRPERFQQLLGISQFFAGYFADVVGNYI
jgi:hypothetical protein